MLINHTCCCFRTVSSRCQPVWWVLVILSCILSAELPKLEVGRAMEAVHYSAPTSVSHNGFLFKTASMARAVSERKAREGNIITDTHTHTNHAAHTVYKHTFQPPIIVNTNNEHSVFLWPFQAHSISIVLKSISNKTQSTHNTPVSIVGFPFFGYCYDSTLH